MLETSVSSPVADDNALVESTHERDASKLSGISSGGSLLDAALEQPVREGEPNRDILASFFAATTTAEAISLWLGENLQNRRLTKQEIALRLNRDVSRIDSLITDQVNAILHHEKFQKLESAWRGLKYLTDTAYREGQPNIKVKVLSISWREVERDLERAPEFDQSQIFKRIYDDEFGQPGGEPFGLMIGDYAIHPRPSKEHPHDDVATLKRLSGVVAAAFCPFVASAAPAMFGLNEYGTLEGVRNLERIFQQKEYIPWRSFRDTPDSRFVGLALPRVLMRLPYERGHSRQDDFCFAEDVSGLDYSKYLWGSAAYAFGAVAIRAYAQSGWFAEIRGVRRSTETGGLVTGLPVHSFGSDALGVALKSSAEVVIAESQEAELANLGFIPLCQCKDEPYTAFHSNQSTQKAAVYDRPEATHNARLMTMLQYTLCASRFAHYLKVIARDKVGMFDDSDECERFLERWVMNYVTPDEHAKEEIRARRPLKNAKVEVKSDPSDPGHYRCVMHLSPHYQLDNVTALFKLYTTLNNELTS